VARDFGTPQPVATMTERQLARRQALLDAVMQLAAERGLLNVQMKFVAERSGVALGTAYRYFASKDHLLACALAEWHGRLVSQVLTERPTGEARLTPDEAADRLVSVVHRGLRGFQRQPNYAALLTYVLSSHDPFASEVLTGINRGYDDILREILGELPEETRSTVGFLVGSLWYNAVLSWSTGRTTLADAFRQTENAIRMLVPAAYEAPMPSVASA
jgi:TetR/AcrR family transcriptional regulator, cholesterol catabolism regulator